MAMLDTPVMRQYAALKAAHAGALVMFRMGDFYELFGDDATTAAGVLNITLTKRRTASATDEGIPMCGVPYHAAEGYVGKLVEQGYRVALAEQTETPEAAKKARGSGALLGREVVRIFTPGTLTEESYLPRGQARCVVAVCGTRAVAWLDVSTGEVGAKPVTATTLGAVLAALPVGEVIVEPSDEAAVLALGVVKRLQVSVQVGLFSTAKATATLQRVYGVATLDGFGFDNNEALVQALGAVVGYAEVTQLGKLPTLQLPTVALENKTVQIDVQTRKNLELMESTAGVRADGLLGVLDQCVTGAGARLLAKWVQEPLTEVAVIRGRQQCVGHLVADAKTRAELVLALRETGDVARCMSRLLLERGSPRDLSVLRQTGVVLPKLHAGVKALGDEVLWGEVLGGLVGLDALTSVLGRALGDDPLPALRREGGYIRDGYDAELDRQRTLVARGNELLAEMEAKEAADSGIGALKLRYNKVWGYYFELGKAQEGKVPGHFVHRQTTVGTHRYTTPALMELERQLSGAGAAALAREEELFEQLVADVKKASVTLLNVAQALATLDVLCSLATVAAKGGWVCPTVEDGTVLDIEGGKHPVVCARVADYVPNDCRLGDGLSDGKLWLLTGPNMAGKSTFLRQNALLVLLAQMGSWVPATRMRVGVVDAVFSRIGAADNLAAGQSTFMVEMVETAQILNRATPRSLVILDELGRGTATYDGLALAWACVEDVVGRIRCRTLFATHYHELTALSATLPAVENYQLAVKTWKDEVIFLHQVTPGAAVGSFGISVAKLAGVPPPVVKRAQVLLDGFTHVAKAHGVVKVDELSLFAAPVQVAPVESEVERRLRGVDVENMSPRAAWDLVAELRTLARDG